MRRRLKRVVTSILVAILCLLVILWYTTLTTPFYIRSERYECYVFDCRMLITTGPPGFSTFPGTSMRARLIPSITGISPITIVNVPLWMFAAVVGAPVVIRFVRRPSKLIGGCANCGYDLTGNVSGRCPECGTEVWTETR